MAPSPIVSAEQVTGVADAYLDRMADLARRLDVPVAAVAEVTRRAGVATVDACAREPETVGDILGRWAANIQTLATRVRSGTTSAIPVAGPVSTEGEAGAVSSGREARATAAVVEGLDERRRLALLLRDSYDAPPGAVAVALGVGIGEAETIVAEARLRLMEGINGRPAPTLAGHEAIAGVSLGTLGALADGSASEVDPTVRLRRRHVGGCQACAAILDSQNRARVVMAGLPVLALPDTARQATLEAIVTRAGTGLLTEIEVEAAVARDARILPTAVVGVALALALIVGVGLGAILRHAKTSASQTPSPTSSGVILSTPTATSTAKSTATPTASPTTSPTDTPSFLRSYSPVPVATSARPTASKAKPKKSASAKPTKATSRAPATTHPPETSPSAVAPTSEAPASMSPTTGAPASSAPATNTPPTAPVIIPTH